VGGRDRQGEGQGQAEEEMTGLVAWKH